MVCNVICFAYEVDCAILPYFIIHIDIKTTPLWEMYNFISDYIVEWLEVGCSDVGWQD
jgi:hypothetical protein